MAKEPKPKASSKLKPPKIKATPVEAPASAAAPSGPELRGVMPITGLVERLTGARLCYGEPVREAGRTVIPVARVRATGGLGFGRGMDREGGTGGGGGGGGTIDALPFGFIDIGPEGARFERIEDPESATRALRAVAAAAVTVATAIAGLRAARGGRRRLSRGR